MNEFKLYKFIRDRAMQCSWEGEQLLLWIIPSDIETFAEMIDREDADDGGLIVQLRRDGTLLIELDELLDEYDIEPTDFVEKGEVILN